MARVIQADAQPAPVGQLALLVEARLVVEEVLHLAEQIIAGGDAESKLDELGETDVVGTNPALLASRVGKQQLTVAHVVEEQARAGLVERALGRHDPARHILQGEAAQTRAHGKGLGAEELLQHVGERFELDDAVLKGCLVEVIEPRGVAAPHEVHERAGELFHGVVGHRRHGRIEVAVGRIVGAAVVVDEHLDDAEGLRAAVECHRPNLQHLIHGTLPLTDHPKILRWCTITV